MFKHSFVFLMFAFSTLIATAGVKSAKNINYAGNADEANTLNIYYPGDIKTPNKPVLIFIHGGSWSSGKKETYWWLGRNFAKKGIVSVVINYPLAPNADYRKMAADCALAVKWVKENISKYGGNDQLIVMGHSAGAHLAELINADPAYFKALQMANPIKGVVLNDPFGLDMYEYLTKTEKDHYYFDFIRTFSDKNENWKLGSPLNYATNIRNPHLLLYGQHTYDAIKIQTPRLHQLLLNNGVPSTILEIPRRKHVPMISQMIFGSNILYQHITEFIKNNFRGL